MQNFQDYIEILKILRNTVTQNKKFTRLVWTALLDFVEKPLLFNNFDELLEVDKLHISLYKVDDHRIGFSKDVNSRYKSK